jgi:hypothetical protein
LVGKVSTGKAFRNQTHPNSRIFAFIYLKIGCCFGGFGWFIAPHLAPHFMHIEERGKSLIIRWRVDSKKYHKTLKNHNNPVGWLNAKSVMTSIKKDILSGHFDPMPYM